MKPSEIMKEHGAWTGLGEVLDKKCISKERYKKELKEVLENKNKYNGKTILELAKENQKLKTKILGLEGENKELTEQNTQLLVKLKESK